MRLITPDWQTRVVATNLPARDFPVEVFGDLYHQRWRIEESYKRLKHRAKLESVSSLTQHALQVDVYAKVLADNLGSLVCQGAFIRKPPHNATLDCHPPQMPFTTLIHLGCVCFNETFHPALKQLPVRLEPLLACIAGCPTPASPPQKAHTGAARVRSSMPVNRLGKTCRIPSRFAQGWLGG